MKVRQLIEQLQQLDPELQVVVSGYEGGYHHARVEKEPFDMCLNVYNEWYYGPHERLEVIGENTKDYKIVKAICL